MRIHITSSLLALLLAQKEWSGVSAFGVDPRPSRTASPASSLRAAEFVDAIATGASAVTSTGFDALNNINIEEIKNADASGLNLEVLKNINLDAIKNINVNLPDGIPNFDDLAAGSGAAVGGAFGTAGFLVGSLTSNSAQQGEAKSTKNKIAVQTKQIEELSADLASAKEKVDEIKTDSDEAIDSLEEKIFFMDQEFEESTEALKQDFEDRVRRELQNRSDNIEEQFKFKYDIKMMQGRAEMLQQQLQFVEKESAATSLAKQEEVAMAKIEVSKKQAELASLQTELSLSQRKIKSLKTMIVNDQNSFNPFASAGLRLEVEDLTNDLSKMADALITKQQEVDIVTAELEILKQKRSNPFYFIKELFQQNDSPAVFEPKAPALPPPMEQVEVETERVVGEWKEDDITGQVSKISPEKSTADVA